MEMVVWSVLNYKFYESKLSKENMSGVNRTYERVANSSEVFTLEKYVNTELDKLDQKYFIDASLLLIDPCCGDGNYLAMMLLRRIKNGIDFESAISTIFGVDLQEDNIKICRNRLLCGSNNPQHIEIVERNIVCANALTYDFSFNSTNQTDAELRFNTLFK